MAIYTLYPPFHESNFYGVACVLDEEVCAAD
jgi:hypothetical protein